MSERAATCQCWGDIDGNVHFCSLHEAAPDLYEALEGLLLLCDEEGHDGFCNFLLGEEDCSCGAEKARAALAKARGEVPA